MEEEKSQDGTVDLQKEAKKIVMSKLEESGLIDKMKAQIKANVLKILDNQKEGMKQQLDFDYMTPLFRQNKPKEVVLLCQLIKEFMKFYEMEYTLPIFENESNIKETVKRETLLKEMNMIQDKEEKKPVLLQMLIEYQKQKTVTDAHATTQQRFGGYVSRTDDDINRIVPSTIDISNLNPLKPKSSLPPLGFNKSVEMNSEPIVDTAAKFNSLNISDVYKRDKTEKKEEVTANDILNKNNSNTNYDPVLGVISNKDEKKVTDDLIIGGEIPEIKDEDEFKEQVLEDNEESKKSFNASDSNINSMGFDSSVKDTSNKQFDYAEEAEKPK